MFLVNCHLILITDDDQRTPFILIHLKIPPRLLVLIPTKRLTAKAVLAHPWLAFDHKTAELGRWSIFPIKDQRLHVLIMIRVTWNLTTPSLSSCFYPDFRVTRLETSRMRRHLARWRWMVIRRSIQVIHFYLVILFLS